MPFLPRPQLTPRLTRNFTTSRLPSWHAKKNGVEPASLMGSRLTASSARSAAMSRRQCWQQMKKGVFPFELGVSRLALCATRNFTISIYLCGRRSKFPRRGRNGAATRLHGRIYVVAAASPRSVCGIIRAANVPAIRGDENRRRAVVDRVVYVCAALHEILDDLEVSVLHLRELARPSPRVGGDGAETARRRRGDGDATAPRRRRDGDATATRPRASSYAGARRGGERGTCVDRDWRDEDRLRCFLQRCHADVVLLTERAAPDATGTF